MPRMLGLFELSWNVACAGCGGILHSAGSLRTIDRPHYTCALCALDCEPDLDAIVEVTFTVDPRVRRIAAHDPDTLPPWDYARQVFWSSDSDLPDDLAGIAGRAALDVTVLAPGERADRRVHLVEGLAILFDPATHNAQFLDVSGPPAESPQALAVVIDGVFVRKPTLSCAPGPLALTIENRTDQRVLPILWIAGKALKALVARRIPVLTAKRLLTHQTFRDLYRTGVLDVHQRFKITNLTFLFSDLKGSTRLYERIGDLAAFDLIRTHFHIAQEIIAREGGAVVKTMGDAIMATFPKPARSLAAALAIREAIDALDGRDDLRLKIGVHSGPCLAVLMNERQDYFGQTVNIASRQQGIASVEAIAATAAVAEDAEARALIGRHGAVVESAKASLRGIDQEVLVYGIPYRESPAAGRKGGVRRQ